MRNDLLMEADKIKINKKKYTSKIFFKSDNNMIVNCWPILLLNNFPIKFFYFKQ